MKWIFVFWVTILLLGCSDKLNETEATTKHLIMPTSSEISLHLDETSRILTAKSKDNKILWSVDVIEQCGISEDELIGEPIIRDVTIREGIIIVVFGKHDSAAIDLVSGNVTWLGSD